ncbi:MAG: hypothetical protein M5U07_24620 [Xanthobacteraceae bacterium]|nr:hypothetical protein [Xanthobacteraceae bacterium]
MELKLEWTRRIPLKNGAPGLIYTVDLEKLPWAPGVYIFGRTFGRNFEALYVGRAQRIRGRIRGQLNNLRLMNHIKEASSGRRILLAGVFKAKPGQPRDKCLMLIERALIRYFLAEDHDLVNVSGTKLRQHEIVSSGKHPKRYFRKKIALDSK